MLLPSFLYYCLSNRPAIAFNRLNANCLILVEIKAQQPALFLDVILKVACKLFFSSVVVFISMPYFQLNNEPLM